MLSPFPYKGEIVPVGHGLGIITTITGRHRLDTQAFVQQRVHTYYWHDDINCATTTLKILSERFGVALDDQVVDSALGMHGAGKYRAQCGLVEGALMFLGIIGRARGFSDDEVVEACYDFARQFEDRFGSLSCKVLRPEGFDPDNPPHICAPLTRDAIVFDIVFVSELVDGRPAADRGCS